MMSAVEYADFLQSKTARALPVGLSDIPELSPHLFAFQRDIVRMALIRGRSAIFADTGLGKGFMCLEWLRVIAEHTDSPVLLLAPLAVSHQFVREAAKFGETVRIVEDQAQVGPGINVTNYHKLHKFDATAFGGVAIDESSILKAQTGKYRAEITDAFSRTAFRLALTATPAPNDYMELGNHAEFLGVMSRTEMLAMFFVHDGETTQEWRLKGHAADAFWRWVASWAVTLRLPSDLGYDDAGYVLKPLRFQHHIVPADQQETFAAGVLFAEDAKTLADQRHVRRATLERRVQMAADIANATAGPVIVWCDLNDEGDALERAIPGSVQVAGKDSDDHKERAMINFAEGRARVLISKSSVCGFGMNWQHCATVVFCGVTNSFEQFYQAIRRCWRFGQTQTVTVHVISSELEGRVIDNLARKQRDADTMANAMVAAMASVSRNELRKTSATFDSYSTDAAIRIPSWLTAD